ncbi:MAG: hypothetical protein VKK62_01405 [Synechococcaceae cyanobacterium]|nr:hypothetical protein [Synechococcaceae cyanobacterium]
MPRRSLTTRWLPLLLVPLGGATVAAAPALDLLIGPAASRAQDVAPLNEVRALNFAREYAVRLNGGLTVYRPAQCMFTTSAATNPCLIRSDRKGFTYRFLGGPPGWVSQGKPATRETELKVSTDGRSLVKLIYNGKPR